MRILVSGGHNYEDGRTVWRTIAEINESHPGPHTLVHGNGDGTDQLARYYACYIFEWENETHRAEWGQYGYKAGPIRNQKMIDAGADLLIAFSGGKDTSNMVRRAEKAQIPVRHVIEES